VIDFGSLLGEDLRMKDLFQNANAGKPQLVVLSFDILMTPQQIVQVLGSEDVGGASAIRSEGGHDPLFAIGRKGERCR